MNNGKSFSDKWWWRTLKVIYVLTWLLILIIVPSIIIPLISTSLGYVKTGNPSFWPMLIADLVVSFIIVETIKSILLYIMGKSILCGLLKLIWTLKWFVVGGVIGLILEPLLGSTRLLIAWVVYMVVVIGFVFSKDYLKKKKNIL